jgi:hypothetical protein
MEAEIAALTAVATHAAVKIKSENLMRMMVSAYPHCLVRGSPRGPGRSDVRPTMSDQVTKMPTPDRNGPLFERKGVCRALMA